MSAHSSLVAPSSDTDSSSPQPQRDEIVAMREALRAATARSAATVRHDEELKHEQDRASKKRSRDTAKKAASQIEELQAALQKKEMEKRDLNYELAKLRREKEELLQRRRLMEARTRASLDSLRDGLKGVEETVEHRQQQLKVDVRHLQQLLQALSRHTLRGYHTGPSTVSVSLLKALQNGLQNLLDLAPEVTRTSGEEVQVRIDQPSALPLSEEMELVRRLEEENAALQETVAQMTSQMTRLQREAALSSLIPQYRMCVTRARAQAQASKDRLSVEQEASALLKEQLQAAHLQLEEILEQQKRTQAYVVSLESSMAHTPSTSANPNPNPSHPHAHTYPIPSNIHTHTNPKRSASQTQTRLGAEPPRPQSTSSIGSEIGRDDAQHSQTNTQAHRSDRNQRRSQRNTHTYDPLEEEDIALSRDIRLLDDEILGLRTRLEEAALTHTHHILQQVALSHVPPS